MKLLIVESPSKAKTIEKYLKGAYTVRSSIGHIRDLPKSNKDAIDIPHGFIPHYEISPEKKKVVRELMNLAEKAKEIVLATDPDREGEAIAWHLSEILTADKKVTAPISRATFNEITESAVTEALKHPRTIDQHLRQAQEARRVLDRLVGYDLSGLIWKKVRYGLSAGRVQSPALRILMEREREIRAFIPESYFIISGLFHKEKMVFPLVCDKELKDQTEADRIILAGKKNPWHIVSIKESEVKRAARPPFTTSTLQQTASSRLGFSPSRTMRAAQKLYEGGHVTYMRTDSTSLSKNAQEAIVTLVEKIYGKNYAQKNFYKTKAKNAQEAHEAIRPTTFSHKKNYGNTDDERRLYQLIWERAVSSQMVPAHMIKTKVSANITGDTIPNFSTHGSRIIFDGWLACDTRARGEDVEVPKLVESDAIHLDSIERIDKETTPPNRYSEAGLIKELEKRGIGRPSTYASIISTIVERGYVEKQGRTLIPTDTGDVVSSFLEEHFLDYISDTFTAQMEQQLDDIAEGKRGYTETLKEFYTPFSEDVAKKESIPKVTTLGNADAQFVCPKCGSGMDIKLGRTGKFLSCSRYPECDGALTLEGAEVGTNTPLGYHPETQLPIYVMNGRFGPYVQMGASQEKIKKVDSKAEKERKGLIPKPKMASIPPSIKIEHITLDQAIHLLVLPRTLGSHPDDHEPVIANIGRFGPYVGHGKNFRSIKKSSGLDPYTISLAEALTILAEPKSLPKGVTLAKNIGPHPKTGKDIEILKSKKGYFIKQGLKRIFFPDSFEPEKTTREEVLGYLNEKK
jgi:DNA topoisomerase I